jgi:hypothetical protein
MSNDDESMEITPAKLLELWREIALYLEFWDLIGIARSGGGRGRVAAVHAMREA